MITLNFISICLVAFSIFLLFYIHIVRSELKFSEFFLSRYAIGKKGLWVRAGMGMITISEIIAALTLFKLGQTVPAILLLLASSGSFLVGVFNWYKIVDGKKIISEAHDLGANIELLFFPVALMVYANKVPGATFTLAIASIQFLLIGILSHEKPHMQEFKLRGFVEKMHVILTMIWLIVFAYQNLSVI